MTLPNLTQISDALDKIMPELTPVPVGTVAYAHEVPTGWLQCNGAAVSRTTYARLFRKIGTKYGAGDGSTTFNLPNIHRRFIEGTTSASEVADTVSAGLPDISGSVDQIAAFNSYGSGKGALDWGSTGGARTSSVQESAPVNLFFTASNSDSIYGRSYTVQPSALRLFAIIKI